jgi:hypothetical protein
MRSSAVPVGGLETVDTGYTLSASRFLGCRDARNHGSLKRVQNSRAWGASKTELTATVAEIVHIDDKTSRTIDAYLDPGLFQGLIESTNT